ncbi:ChrR family anti-sigma-E factor [Roseateles sp. SL47]|uniref:ChrR family anti-sigma-E factor n=1 Tax=Roseateles sp. SL47 TaxID=2995138 RepID=UPI002270A044|nr:ChrR family anti-sigma-E factor [Roseateles sp. SL47]WAC71736.1 ChrR family anti-sigma-E factor [Roseateles sp. SL47]
MTVSAPITAIERSAPSLDIRHHPADDLLLAYAAGSLSVGIALVTQIHLELCSSCRARVSMLEALGGVVLEDQPPVAMADDALARVLARIDAQDAAEGADSAGVRRVAAPPPLPMGAVWPKALAHCSATRWRWLGPGMRWSRVTVPDAPQANVFLLRIGAGKYLPQHTHRGTELTQVIYGHFHDGRALYGPGDFDLADGDVHHQPVVQDGSECICIAAVDGRLNFDGFIARWFGSLVGM